jgi:hypothetical protein
MTNSQRRAIAGIILTLSGMTMNVDARAQEQGRAGPPLANPLAAQPLDQLSATLDRSLFSPSRRGAPAPPPVAQLPVMPASPSQPPNVVLYGVVMDGESARAVVRVGPEKRLLRAQMGDDIDGWKVAQIDGRKVVLASEDGRFATYRLFNGERSGAESPDWPKN